MIVVDVEATGTDPWKHSILSIGAVEFEKPERQFYEECRMFEGAHVMKEALEVNGFTQKEISDKNKKTDGEVVQAFLAWAFDAKDHTFAGHNPIFDFSIIRLTAERYHIDFSLAHRTIDTHSICFARMILNGATPPAEKGRSALNLDTVLEYVGLPSEPKPHNGLRGAILEAEALSRLLRDVPLFDEYKNLPVPWKV